jgi:Ca2+-binding RTX toxin-like protein
LASRLIHCELLETRRLYAGIKLVSHVLDVGGWLLIPNIITVGLAPGGTSVTATISFATVNTPDKIITKTFPLSLVRRVYIVGGKNDDLITIDQTNGSFPIPTRIVTSNGNDTVYGGDEPDTIIGGIGADSLSGGGGNDSIYGEFGNDTIVGGTGNDTLHGGRGIDLVDGSLGGNDVIIAGHGDDTLWGGSGPNTFFVLSLESDTTNFRLHYDHLHKVTIAPTSSDDNGVLDTLGSLLGFL